MFLFICYLLFIIILFYYYYYYYLFYFLFAVLQKQCHGNSLSMVLFILFNLFVCLFCLFICLFVKRGVS